METVSYEGDFHQVSNITLDVVHGNTNPRNVPLMIGSTGEKMTQLAGEIADGCVLNYCVPPDYNDLYMKNLKIGAEKAGRSMDEIDRPQLIVCSIDEDEDKARYAAKWLLTQYVAQQPHIAKASQTPKDIIEKVQSIIGWPATKAMISQAMEHIPDDLVDRISASGTPEQARKKVLEYVNRGCTSPILYPMADDVKLMIDTFAVE